MLNRHQAIQLSQIDLNLFSVFDAIYCEGGITAASRHLHLSQSAVSHALGRLRDLIGDPLFERQGNAMIPTAVACDIAATIGPLLGSLEAMLRRVGEFTPETSQRECTIAVRGASELRFLPAFVDLLSRVAPGMSVTTQRLRRSCLGEALRRGDVDFAIDIDHVLSPDIRRELLSSEKLVVLARAGHPAVHGPLDLPTYLAQGHVLVTGRQHGMGGHEDAALSRLGWSRQIRARCQRHNTASAIVARTDLLTTLSTTQASLVNRQTGNQVLAMPVELSPIDSFLYWHARIDTDPAANWLRAAIRKSFFDSTCAHQESCTRSIPLHEDISLASRMGECQACRCASQTTADLPSN